MLVPGPGGGRRSRPQRAQPGPRPGDEVHGPRAARLQLPAHRRPGGARHRPARAPRRDARRPRPRSPAATRERLAALGAAEPGAGDPDDLVLPLADRGAERRSWFVYVVRLPAAADRDGGHRRARPRAGSTPVPTCPASTSSSLYRERFGYREGEFPVAEDFSRRSLALPFYPALPRQSSSAWSPSSRGILGRRPDLIRPFIDCADAPLRARARSRLLAAQRVAGLRPPPGSLRRPPVARARPGAARRRGARRGELDRAARGPRRVAAELEAGELPVRGRRRGHPHGDRAPADRDRRPASAASSTPAAPATTRSPPTWRSSSRERAGGRAASCSSRCLERLHGLAAEHRDWRLPGYTHLQRAQPVSLGHHLLAWFWMLRRDVDRFDAAARAQPATMPLGSRRARRPQLGARPRGGRRRARLRRRRRELDRRRLQPRLRARLPERGGDLRDPPLADRRRDRPLVDERVRLLPARPRSSRSGSSIMPQKMNPDAAELLRAKAPRVVAVARDAGRGPARPAARLLARTCRRTRSRSSTPPTRSSSACGPLDGMLAGIELRPRADGRRGGRRDGRRHRRRRPARPPRDAVPRGPRRRRRARPPRARARHRPLGDPAPTSCAGFSELLDEEYYEVLAEGSWLDSKVSRGGTSADGRRRASSSSRRRASPPSAMSGRAGAPLGSCGRSSSARRARSRAT